MVRSTMYTSFFGGWGASREGFIRRQHQHGTMEKRTIEGRTIHALTEEEYSKVIDYVDEEYGTDSYGRVHPVRFTVRTLLATGIRSGELAHLSDDWVITHEGMPTVKVQTRDCDCSYCQKQAKRNVARNEEMPNPEDDDFEDVVAEERAEMWYPKSNSSERAVTVYNDEAWSVINQFLDEHGDDVVNPNTIWQRVKKVDGAFDFGETLSPHKLRHSAATHMHRMGVDKMDISKELGHASVETTEIYVQEPYASRAARIREKMEDDE